MIIILSSLQNDDQKSETVINQRVCHKPSHNRTESHLQAKT